MDFEGGEMLLFRASTTAGLQAHIKPPKPGMIMQSCPYNNSLMKALISIDCKAIIAV
jgi:hypothetical protein